MLAGFAAGETTIGRSIIEEVAETFDMLPSGDRGMQSGEEREAPARIFSDAGRAEIWAAGNGQSEEESEDGLAGTRGTKIGRTKRRWRCDPNR